MQLFKRIAASFLTRRTRHLHDLSDWVLAPLGTIAFLIAGYWTMAVTEVLPDLVTTTNQTGLTWIGVAAFTFLGGQGLTIWFYGCLAARCHSILFDRHFR
ncbi:hypothetical protein [Marinobacterium stanieri]|uniref:hypothetical protein n=1 Tax=Marinobacterium stanieri TaxID=49186 RepID=UPI000971480E|nr:hypothetical protein [Marinobacterium stanieri]